LIEPLPFPCPISRESVKWNTSQTRSGEGFEGATRQYIIHISIACSSGDDASSPGSSGDYIPRLLKYTINQLKKAIPREHQSMHHLEDASIDSRGKRAYPDQTAGPGAS
jgi:hypothetical protein